MLETFTMLPFLLRIISFTIYWVSSIWEKKSTWNVFFRLSMLIIWK